MSVYEIFQIIVICTFIGFCLGVYVGILIFQSFRPVPKHRPKRKVKEDSKKDRWRVEHLWKNR